MPLPLVLVASISWIVVPSTMVGSWGDATFGLLLAVFWPLFPLLLCGHGCQYGWGAALYASVVLAWVASSWLVAVTAVRRWRRPWAPDD